MSYAVAMECALPMPLVSTEWLANNIDAVQLRIIDASWYLPAEQRDSAAEFAQQHVPGALFFDIDRICDRHSELPHMAPDTDAFATAVSRLGINSDDRIVVYDTAGLFSAARVWWLFRLMGSASVAVLDGGLPKWLAEARPTDAGDMPIPSARFDAVLRAQHVCDRHAVAAALRTGSAQVVDARPAARFAGLAPEPRAGLSPGHMPGAKQVFFKSLLADDGTLLPVDALRRVFGAAGVDLAAPIITSCGSGVTAAVLSLALEVLGHRDHALYDGSWSEWAATPGCEIIIDG